MIVFENVTKNYQANVGLNNASVHIKSGDFVFLVGPSGAGKTTFIRLILKELEPDSGKITVAGKDITHLSRREIPMLRQKIGMVFQDFRLLEKKTVYENVAFAMEVVHKNKKEIAERVPYVLKLVDIEDKANRYPSELSAGEQQRVGIARALANQPRMLICDEPTGNLDPVTAMDIMALLEQINLRGTTILMVTHAKDIVDKMQKRVVAIENGNIVRDEAGSYGYKTLGDSIDALGSYNYKPFTDAKYSDYQTEGESEADTAAKAAAVTEEAPKEERKPAKTERRTLASIMNRKKNEAPATDEKETSASYKGTGFNYDTGYYDIPTGPDDSVFGNSLQGEDAVFAHSYSDKDDFFGIEPMDDSVKSNYKNTISLISAYLGDDEEDQ